jgi:hypothetical protein
MRKVFETRKRLLAVGLAGALILALSVVGGLWFAGAQNADAQLETLNIMHVNPDGSDFTGNPFCPQTVWSADGNARVVSVAPWHDCNNAAGQHHLIRTEGYELIADDDGDSVPSAPNAVVGTAETLCDGVDNDGDTAVDDGVCLWPETPPNACNDYDDDGDTVVDDGQCIDEDPVDGIDNDGDEDIDEDPPNITNWVIQNVGANAAIVRGPNFCWVENQTFLAPNFDPVNWNEICIAITSTAPGETSIQATFNVPSAVPPISGEVTNTLVKEWDKFIDTVILKAFDVELVAMPSPFPSGTRVALPLDADSDGDRDADDEHLMDHNGELQEHQLIFDEGIKLSKSADGPIQLIESVHGQHADFPDHPTDGAVVLAFIDSNRGCTYFTDPTDPGTFLGTAVVGITDWRGFFIGPQVWPAGAQFNAEALGEAAAAGLEPGLSNNGDDQDVDVDFEANFLGVYVDSVCEEQATITFKVGYPNFVQSVPEIPAPEFVRINWTTVELAKQPQIRWAGEEIVLEKRWALPGEWFPNLGAGIDNDDDGLINEDPADDDNDGLINEEFDGEVGVDDDWDGNENNTRAEPGFGNCNDGIDNDADTDVDGDDAGCAAFIDEDTGQDTTEDNDDDCVGDAPEDPAHDIVIPGGAPGSGEPPIFDGFDPGTPSGPGNFVGGCSVAGGIDEDGPDFCPWTGMFVKYSKLGGPGGLISGLNAGFAEQLQQLPGDEPDVVWSIVDENCISRALYSSEDPGEVDVEATLHASPSLPPFNKHAFLVWYIKIYQVKLENVPLADNVGREFHNAGTWEGADPLDLTNGVTEETLNVSQDALARVVVKGWMYTADLSGHGAVCIDMDGDGDGVDDDADTLLNEDPDDGEDNDGDTEIDEDTQVAGQPYPVVNEDVGCPDSNDEMLENGYWVLPDDMEALAGPDPDRLASWDVMSEPDVSADDLIGYKSTLDSHDTVLRRFVDCVVLRTDGTPNFNCTRKTVDPDGAITDADAIMPPLKILAQILDDDDGAVEDGEAGFLKAADKDGDLDISSAYVRALIAASPWIPTPVNNGGYDWDSWGYSLPGGMAQGPYNFYDILTKHEVMDELQRVFIRDFRFYTDNRGLGYFFINGDFNLTFDDCLRQQLSGSPFCKPNDVVGISDLTVIGDYPYFRKHPAVESNLITKTWTWGGFKSVTAEKLDATHTRVIAHLKDRDGYCKWSVDEDPTEPDDSVIFSPSINEVQHEWIEFLLNTDIGFIRGVSPNSLYLGDVSDQHSQIDFGLPIREIVKINDHVHMPLAEEWSNALEEGIVRDADRAALARAEDVRVLDFYGEGAAVDAKYVDPEDPDECQAWVLIEHPADETPNVSVVFHDPEGNIDLHYPTSQFVSILSQGWNDSCYTGPEMDIEDALTDAGLIEEDGTSHVLAVYRFTNDDAQAFDHWFPGREDIEDTITTIAPYDQLFLLLDSPMNWAMDVVADTVGKKDTQVSLIQNWSSVCYAGVDKAPEEAAASINNNLVIMYTLASDQSWRRYVPNREELTNIITLNQYTSVFTLMTNAGIWVFDP